MLARSEFDEEAGGEFKLEMRHIRTVLAVENADLAVGKAEPDVFKIDTPNFKLTVGLNFEGGCHVTD